MLQPGKSVGQLKIFSTPPAPPNPIIQPQSQLRNTPLAWPSPFSLPPSPGSHRSPQTVLPTPLIMAVPNSSRHSLGTHQPSLLEKQADGLAEAGRLASGLHSLSSPPSPTPSLIPALEAGHLVCPRLSSQGAKQILVELSDSLPSVEPPSSPPNPYMSQASASYT